MKIFRIYVENMKFFSPLPEMCEIFYFKLKSFSTLKTKVFLTVIKKVILSTCMKNLNVNSNF